MFWDKRKKPDIATARKHLQEVRKLLDETTLNQKIPEQKKNNGVPVNKNNTNYLCFDHESFGEGYKGVAE